MTDTIIARVGQTLVWYDGPIIQELHFKGRLGETQCLAIEGKENHFVGFFPSADMMARYRARTIDLRTLMLHPETERYRFSSNDYTPDNNVILHTMEEDFTEEMLPDKGYFHADL